jgi:DNA (cytosine-5)-methyltransferase 1
MKDLNLIENMNQLTHASLFSGIGGFDLAAEMAGFKNIFQVEFDKYCNKVLTKNFPDVTRYLDIKQFDSTHYENCIDVISGGFPCQTFSLAGKGAADLSLWKEMFRICREVKPTYIMAENVYGLIVQKRGVPFELVCADMESIGYEVQPVIIPASGTGACHQRKRVWIIAYSETFREQRLSKEYLWKQNINPAGESETNDDDAADTDKQRGQLSDSREYASEQLFRSTGEKRNVANSCEGNGFNVCGQKTIKWDINKKEQIISNISRNDINSNSNCTSTKYEISARRRMPSIENWESWTAESPICGVDDGVSHRVDRLKGLGNAIVPQIAYEIFKVIKKHLQTTYYDKIRNCKK